MDGVRLCSGVGLLLLSIPLIAGCEEGESPTVPAQSPSSPQYQAGVLQPILWTRQFGTEGFDAAQGVSVHATDAYVVGSVEGALPGHAEAGNFDAFLRRYDAAGTEVWTRQFGTEDFDQAHAVSVNSTGAYVSGATTGTFPGQFLAGRMDGFVRKYDLAGNEMWTRQFGSGGFVRAWAIWADGSGVYVAGESAGALGDQASVGLTDAFVRKFDLDGNEIWTRQFGTPAIDVATAISGDGTGVYVAGQANFDFGSSPSDAFVRKYDFDGNEIWTRRFGTAPDDAARGISVSTTGVYVVGTVRGTLLGQSSAGSGDGFVRKYDLDGNEVWTRRFGTAAGEIGHDVSVHAGAVYVTGMTSGTLPGQVSAGNTDGFVRKYDVDGNEIWTHQFGSEEADVSAGVSADESGVYVAGHANGTFPGQTSAGGADAFVVKFELSQSIVIGVDIAIRPEDSPAPINPRSRGRIAVAILTTPTFDAATVVPRTVRFGRTGTEAAAVHWALEDVDMDGNGDLLLHFRTQGTGLRCGDTFGSLVGATTSGESIHGSDSIRTVGCR